MRPRFSVSCGIAALALVGWGIHVYKPSLKEDRRLRSVSSFRSLEGRLFRQAEHLPYKPFESGEARLPRAAQQRIREFLEDLRRSSGPLGIEKSGDSTLVLLLMGRPGEAISDLEATAPTDARLLSDLSACYIARWRMQDRASDLLRALDAAERAVRASPALPEARFNQALSLELLSLDSAAERAWQGYLTLDGRTGWSAEASRRLAAESGRSSARSWADDRKKLAQASAAGDQRTVMAVVARWPQDARELAEALLGNWGEDQRLGRETEAKRDLAEARALGLALAGLHGELMVADAVFAIERASRAADRLGLAALAKGHEDFKRARREYDVYDLARARASFVAAGAGLAAGGSAFRHWAEFFVQVCDYQSGFYSSVIAGLDHLCGTQDLERYPALLGRIGWLEGLAHFVRGEPTAALTSYAAAEGRFAHLGEQANAGVVQQFQAEVHHHFLGEEEEAWRLMLRALDSTGSQRDPRRAQAIFQGAGFAALQAGFPNVAIDFQDEAVSAAEEQGSPVTLAEAKVVRAGMEAEAGQKLRALHDLAAANALIARISLGPLRQIVEADLFLFTGEVRSSEPAAALAALDAALVRCRATLYSGRLPRLYLARGLAHLRLGQPAQAEADWRAGIAEVERQRRKISTEPSAISFAERADELYERLLDFEVSVRQDWAEGFVVGEANRARALLDATRRPFGTGVKSAPTVAAASSLAEVQRGLPADTALVEYALLPDRVLIWLIDRDHVRWREQRIARHVIERWVEQASGAHPERGLSTLYDLLIGPVERELDAHRALVVVPDESLHRVPFAALWSTARHEYLVERHEVTVAPSAALYASCVARDCRLAASAGEPRLLVVGDPTFDRRLVPGLPDLPAAEKEARSVAALYPGADLVIGGAATRQVLLNETGRHDVLHFVGHAVVNAQQPELSKLLLAPGEGDPNGGLLFAHEISAQRFARTRLVVLSGCDTARSMTARSEGIESLIRPFLVAGVPAGVGSLWSVDDRAGSVFFTYFHERLRVHGSAARALREAQLLFLHSGEVTQRAPRAWAGFVLVGGSCPVKG